VLFLGIDPGNTGAAVAITKAGQLAGICPAAFVRGSLSDDVHRWLLWVAERAAERVVHAAIEEPVMVFRGGKAIHKSASAVAMSVGQWRGMLAAVGIRHVRLVPPRTWQSRILGKFPTGESKAAACRWASMVHRQAMEDAIRRHGDGVADASGIAEWVRMEHLGDFGAMVEELTFPPTETRGGAKP
jgi:hypothetical protein